MATNTFFDVNPLVSMRNPGSEKSVREADKDPVGSLLRWEEAQFMCVCPRGQKRLLVLQPQVVLTSPLWVLYPLGQC